LQFVVTTQSAVKDVDFAILIGHNRGRSTTNPGEGIGSASDGLLIVAVVHICLFSAVLNICGTWMLRMMIGLRLLCVMHFYSPPMAQAMLHPIANVLITQTA